jgi:hypothetical protein
MYYLYIVSLSNKLTMTSYLKQPQQSGEYLNTYFDVFITPRIRAFPNIINTDLRYLEETEKREAIHKLLTDIALYRETDYQWTSDEDDDILQELTHLLLDATLPSIDPPTHGRHKMFCDLMQLQDLLDALSKELHCDEISYFIKEMWKCTPHSALQYELLLKTNQFKVYYNRLKHLEIRLKKSSFDGDSEYAVQTAILSACSNIDVAGEDMIEIPDERDEFLVQWRRKAFDNQTILYPLQKMYRNMPYSRVDVDDWLYAHRAQMKYMNGDAYWRKSPAYTQIESSVRFAFYNYPNVIASDECDFMRRPTDATPDRGWNLESPPSCPYNAPNQTFKTYYDTCLADFCKCVEKSNADRTDEHLAHIYTQASKIRVMSEWMRWGIDGVRVDGFIALASLEPVAKVLPDMYNHPTALYLSLIDSFAYEVCMGENVIKTANTLKMMNSIVASSVASSVSYDSFYDERHIVDLDNEDPYYDGSGNEDEEGLY